MIPGIRWSPAIRWSPGIRWSIRSMDFDNRKIYGDTSTTDGLVSITMCVFAFVFVYLFLFWQKSYFGIHFFIPLSLIKFYLEIARCCIYTYMFLYILFFFISLCNRPFTQCFLSMLSCHWYLIWSIWNNPKNISKRRFQGCRRETCRRASPPENVQIIQQDRVRESVELSLSAPAAIFFGS